MNTGEARDTGEDVAAARSDRSAGAAETPVQVTWRDALGVWCRVAAMSFGGPAGQIAVMHRILVEERRWLSEQRFLHALNFCMLLPGPEAQQLATYIGWLQRGIPGGLLAGGLFVLPGFLSILVLSVLYVEFQHLTLVAGLFYGLKPAVVAIVVAAVFRIGKRALTSGFLITIAAVSFVSITLLQVPFPLIIIAAGLAGVLRELRLPGLAGSESGEASRRPVKPQSVAASAVGSSTAGVINDSDRNSRPSRRRAARVFVTWTTIWLLPVAVLWRVAGRDHVLTQEAIFFSQTAMMTFGGAYAVLAWVGQQCVGTFGWLQPAEMLDGLGMAETTPGPLVQVVQFVGFLAAWRNPGSLPPLVAGIAGSLVTTWVTFAPCFLWIFLGAPFVESLRGKRLPAAALQAITAAVVGVILNLSVWFSLHTLFETVNVTSGYGLQLLVPEIATIDVPAAMIALGAFVALFRFRAGLGWTLAGSVLAGLLVTAATGG